eukprot:1965429-Alexandrium_andersonii.AAC.1
MESVNTHEAHVIRIRAAPGAKRNTQRHGVLNGRCEHTTEDTVTGSLGDHTRPIQLPGRRAHPPDSPGGR